MKDKLQLLRQIYHLENIQMSRCIYEMKMNNVIWCDAQFFSSGKEKMTHLKKKKSKTKFYILLSFPLDDTINISEGGSRC